MKILVYDNVDLTKIGGGEMNFHKKCATLAELGHDVYALFPLRSFEEPQTKTNNYKMIFIKNDLRIKNYSISILKIMKRIEQINPDIIYINDGLSPTDALILLTNKFTVKKPVFVSAQAFYRNPLYNFLVKLQLPIYNLSNGIIVNNPNLKKTLLRWLIKPDKFLPFFDYQFLVPNLPATVKKKENKVFQFLFVGVLDENHSYKGLDSLLKGIKWLKQKYYDEYAKLQFNIIGDGKLRNYYQSLAEKYEISNVHFLGRLKSLEEFYDMSDALVLPSKKRGEGFGFVVVEALMHNLPVLVSKYAGSSFLVKKYNVGEVFDPYNRKDMAKTLITLHKSCLQGTYEENIFKFQKEALIMKERAWEILVNAFEKAAGAPING